MYAGPKNFNEMNKKFKKYNFFSAILIIGFIISEIFLNFNYAGAYQNFSFTQSDFSGSSSTSTPSYPTNNTGWNSYSSKDFDLISTSQGLSLVSSSLLITQNSKSDFDAGTYNQTNSFGNGTSSGIEISINPNWSQQAGIQKTGDVETTSSYWARRRGLTFGTTVFNNQLWLMGGDSSYQNYFHDVWKATTSTNGSLIWTEVLSSAPWQARTDHVVLTYNNKLWVMGGNSSGNNDLNDVWYSSDGINWIEATSSANWSRRDGFSGVVFDNKMWIMGGEGSGSALNDVWYSTDGANWIEATSSAAWQGRYEFSAAVYNNKMWIMAGKNSLGVNLNDVWYSSDGINWIEATSSAAWQDRWNPGVAVFDNKMWIMAGMSTAMSCSPPWYTDVWYSTDGANWIEVTSSMPWVSRDDFASPVFDNKLWIIGGDYNCITQLNDTWYSSDGINWTLSNPNYNYLIINQGVKSLIFNNKLWLIGTDNLGGFDMNGVWYSSDGINWIEATSSPPWSERVNFSTAVYDNKIWVMGGRASPLVSNDVMNDIWYSSDGINWIEATSSANWSPRYGQGTVIYNNKMWIMGGHENNYNNSFSDVWYSSDGINWIEATSSANWSPRYDYPFDIVNNNIWTIEGDYLNQSLKSWFYNNSFYSSGIFISRPISLPNDTSSGFNISWMATTTANTSIKFQIATNNDNSTWNFIGPDGTANTYYDVSGSAVSSANNSSSYLKYKAYLSSSDGLSTPQLSSVSITYHYFTTGTSTQTFTSSIFDSTNPFNQINSLSWSANTLSNSDIKFQIKSAPTLGTMLGTSDTAGGNRALSASIYANGKLYFFGGHNGSSFLNDLRIYDIQSNSWLTGTPDTVGGNRAYDSAVLYNNKIYIFFGYNGSVLNDVRIYDIASDSWSGGTPDTVGGGRAGASAALYNGKVYLFGGYNGSLLNDVRIYDIASDSWSSGAADIAGGNRFLHSAVIYNNKMYVFGGSSDLSTALSDLRIYDFASNSWSSGTSAATSSFNHSAAVYDGKMYIFGGSTGSQVLNSMRIYNFASNSWSSGTSDSTGRNGAGFASDGNFLYEFAGSTSSIGITPTSGLTNDLRIYKFSNDTWYPNNVWCGYADCSGSTYFTSSDNGQLLPNSHPLRSGGNTRYFQYKAFLSSSDVFANPTLSQVSVNYSFFDLKSPAYNTTLSQPTFSWDSASGASSYKLYLDNSLLASTVNTTYSYPSLSCGSHSWYVTAISDNDSQNSYSTNVFNKNCGGGLPPPAYMPPSTPSVSSINSSGGFKIKINNGSPVTNNPIVSLSLDGGPDAKTMVISEDPGFVNIGQIPYTTSTIFTLSSGNGHKTIYVKFYTSWGQTSPVISSTIDLVSTAQINFQGSASSQSSATGGMVKLFTTRLVFGMTNAEVKSLQRILAQDKSIYPEGIISGYFGELTLKAVKKFQEKYHIANPGIVGYGEVGPNTRAKLNQFLVLNSAATSNQESVSSQTSVPTSQIQSSTTSTVQIIQRLEAQLVTLLTQLVSLLRQQVENLKLQQQ